MASKTRKEYLKNYSRLWIAKRRADFFKDKCCVKCGSTERLELDHIDPKTKKSRSAHAIWSFSEKRRLEEIAKCQVLCHNCHLQKTKIDLYPIAVCGTVTKYRHYGCRCRNCKDACAIYKREYRKKLKQNTSL